jgi:hypothetical protein
VAKQKLIEHSGQRYKPLVEVAEYDRATGRLCVRTESGEEWMTVGEALDRKYLEAHVAKVPRKARPAVDALLWNSSASPDAPPLKDPVSKPVPFVVHDSVRAEAAPSEWYVPMEILGLQIALSCGLIHPVPRKRAAMPEGGGEGPGAPPGSLMGHRSPPRTGPERLLLRLRIEPGEFGTEASRSSVIQIQKPIPISRLIGIGVPGGRDEWARIAAGWVSPDVPAPEHLFEPVASGPGVGEVEGAVVEGRGQADRGQADSRPVEDFEASCARFDRYLGLMAFVRGASRFLSARTEHYQGDSAAFLALLSCLLGPPSQRDSGVHDPEPLLCSLLDLDAQLAHGTALLRNLAASDARIIDESAGRAVANAIYEDAARDPLIVRAFKDLFSGDYRSAMQSLQRSSAPVAAMAFAALFKYSSRLSNDHRTLKQRLVEDWPSATLLEIALGVLGAYHGYTALDARETRVYSVHPLIAPLVDERPDIKFHLRSETERALIEALYQQAFTGKISSEEIARLYPESARTSPPTVQKVASAVVDDETYRHRDLIVRQYRVSYLGALVQCIRDLPGAVIDETSELGKVLAFDCVIHADELTWERSRGRTRLRYRIAKEKVEELLLGGALSVRPEVLAAAVTTSR